MATIRGSEVRKVQIHGEERICVVGLVTPGGRTILLYWAEDRGEWREAHTKADRLGDAVADTDLRLPAAAKAAEQVEGWCWG